MKGSSPSIAKVEYKGKNELLVSRNLLQNNRSFVRSCMLCLLLKNYLLTGDATL